MKISHINTIVTIDSGLEEFDEEFLGDKEESEATGPWYVDAVKRWIKLKEEAEDDLICDAGYSRLNMTSQNFEDGRCNRRMQNEVEVTSKMLEGKGRCTVEVWRCFSKVLEGMVKYVEDPREIYRYISPVVYKAVFHGRASSMWGSMMAIPQVGYNTMYL